MTVETRTHPLRLILAAVQPVLFGWAIVVVLGVFAYTLMADSPALGETTWQDVSSVATGWWLTAFGGTLHFDGVVISLPPLLITLLTFAGSYALIRRLAVKDWIDVLIVALSAGAATALLGLLAPMGASWWPAGIGGALVALLAVVSSKNRSDWFGRGFFTSTAGRAIYDGFMLARRALVAASILGTAAFIAACILGWSDILKINGYYIVEWHSNLMMWLFQLAYLPTFILWALAYIIGAGFAVGAGTHFSAFGVTSAPLPAVPILGALPQPGTGTPWIIALVVVPLLILGVRQARAFPTLSEVLVTGGIAIAVVALLGSLLAAAAQGAIGPDRLTVTGMEAPRTAAMSAIVIGLPLVLGMILGHRRSVATYRDWIASAKAAAIRFKDRRSSSEPSVEHRAELRVVTADEAGDRSSAPTAATAQTASEPADET